MSQNVSRRVDKIPRMCTGIEQYGCPGFKVLETQGSIQVKSRFVSTLKKIDKKGCLADLTSKRLKNSTSSGRDQQLTLPSMMRVFGTAWTTKLSSLTNDLALPDRSESNYIEL